MKGNFLLFMSIVTLAACLIPLKKDRINEDYAIGKLIDIHFTKNDELFFKSEDRLFGFIDRKTGSIESVYELQHYESLLDLEFRTEVLLTKDNKYINIFTGQQKDYSRMYPSQGLKKQKFKEILGGKFGVSGFYVLTDSFLKYFMRPKPTADGKPSTLQVLSLVEQKDGDKQQYWSLFSIGSFVTAKLGMVSFKEKDGVKQICIRVFDDKQLIKQNCLTVDSLQVEDVIYSGSQIYVEYEQSALILNMDLEKVGELDERPQQYHNGLVSIGQDHKSYSPKDNAIYDYRIIKTDNVNKDSTELALTMKVKEKEMLIEKKDKDVAIIPKEKDMNPRKSWVIADQADPTKYELVIEYSSGLLQFYKLDQSTKSARKIWSKITKKADITPDEQDAANQINASSQQNDKREEDIQINQDNDNKGN